MLLQFIARHEIVHRPIKCCQAMENWKGYGEREFFISHFSHQPGSVGELADSICWAHRLADYIFPSAITTCPSQTYIYNIDYYVWRLFLDLVRTNDREWSTDTYDVWTRARAYVSSKYWKNVLTFLIYFSIYMNCVCSWKGYCVCSRMKCSILDIRYKVIARTEPNWDKM